MFVQRTDGGWNHRPARKTLCNPILRKIQFWTDRPYVIASVCSFNEHKRPVFERYTFTRVKRLWLSWLEYLQCMGEAEVQVLVVAS